MQGHLASIPNQETHEFLKGLGEDVGQQVWVGGYWNNDEWHWSDGTPFQYQGWIPGEPNRDDQRCTTMFLNKDHRWDDDNCSWKFYRFFCQQGKEETLEYL